MKKDIMRNKAIYLATLLCVPAAAALIANAPVAVADNPNSFHACTGNEVAANVVRTAATAGDNHSACS
jgi:hypothetical protein